MLSNRRESRNTSIPGIISHVVPGGVYEPKLVRVPLRGGIPLEINCSAPWTYGSKSNVKIRDFQPCKPRTTPTQASRIAATGCHDPFKLKLRIVNGVIITLSIWLVP